MTECEICGELFQETEGVTCNKCDAVVCYKCVVILTIKGPTPGSLTARTLCQRCLDKSTPLELAHEHQMVELPPIDPGVKFRDVELTLDFEQVYRDQQDDED